MIYTYGRIFPTKSQSAQLYNSVRGIGKLNLTINLLGCAIRQLRSNITCKYILLRGNGVISPSKGVAQIVRGGKIICTFPKGSNQLAQNLYNHIWGK